MIINPFPPALSFSASPDIRRLFDVVLQHGPATHETVTILCGAGVSMDAGLPSWHGLVERMLTEVREDLREWIEQDPVDLSRKVSIVDALLPPHKQQNPDVIRRALFDGGATPGLLARSIAQLAHAMRKKKLKVQIATLNFDDLIEQALLQECGVKAKSFVVTELAEWRKSRLGIMHLHGFIPCDSGLEPKKPIVLGEADFYRHGHQVQKVLVDIFKTSHTVLVGLSMTDPNIVAALLTMQERSGKRTATKSKYQRFLVVSPERVPSIQPSNEKSVEQIHREYMQYSHLRTRAIAKHLGVTPIFLNSIGQNSQLFVELRLACNRPKQYMAEDSSIRYGRRLMPYLEDAHVHFGLRDSHGNDTWDQAVQAEFTIALEAEMNKTKDLLMRLARDLDRHNASGHELTDQTSSEQLGLFLWVRSLIDGRGNPEYTLELAGTSSYTHRQRWSAKLIAPVAPGSRYPVSDAVYFGNARHVSVDASTTPRPLWKTILACPINMEVAGAEIPCGAITLNSHSAESILGQLRPEDTDQVIEHLKQLGANCFPAP